MQSDKSTPRRVFKLIDKGGEQLKVSWYLEEVHEIAKNQFLIEKVIRKLTTDKGEQEVLVKRNGWPVKLKMWSLHPTSNALNNPNQLETYSSCSDHKTTSTSPSQAMSGCAREQTLELQNNSPNSSQTQRRMGSRTARDSLSSPNPKLQGDDIGGDRNRDPAK